MGRYEILKQFDPDTSPGPVPSPCVSICTLARDTDLCSACGRSLEELIAWSTTSEADKRIIWRRLLQQPAA